MKLFKIDFGIKDRYRRGLSEGVRSNRSPQSETAATAAAAYHHDPHHHAASPTSPSALFSASMTSSVHEPAQQWNQFEPPSYQLAAYTLARTSRHTEYDDNDDQDRDASSSDGYLSSSSSSSGSSLTSSSSLSSGQSDEDEDEDMDSEESSEDDEDDDSDNQDSQENEAPKSRGHRTHHHRHHHHHNHHDYYGGGRGHGEHGGLLPIAPAPAIPPSSDRDALEQEARQRRLERDSAKRRQSLTNQAAPDASLVDLTASSKDPLVMELIRDEAERERVDRDYEGDNSSNDIEDDDEEDDEDEDMDEDMDEDECEEESESDESEEGSSSSGSSDDENDSEMDGDGPEAMSRVSMSEHEPGNQDEGDLLLPPQGYIFGDDDIAQDHGYNQGSLGNSGGGATFDLVSSTPGHDPVLHNEHVLQKMEMDYGPGYSHPPEQSSVRPLYNTPASSTTWDLPMNFGQGFQFTFTPFTHTSNHQPQSNRDELHITRSDSESLWLGQDPFVGTSFPSSSSSSSSSTLTPPSLSADSSMPSSSNMLTPRPTYTSNRAFFTPSRSVSHCWKRPKRS
ncbi:hypothetical protein BGZ82_000630 [Podila clonocystis]|nr:hypothetical protein BGZ82_000630 [Podila clonocystis]